jgi:ABC-2 type transport system ATP-binding protein
MSPIIEFQSVGFHYGKREALRDVSFAVQAGGITGFLGPNGGGKSTIFKLASTLMAAETGTIRVEGRDISENPVGVRRLIGVVFQTDTVDLELTAAENLTHQGHLYGLRGEPLKERVAELLRRFGLSDRSNERMKHFSGGLRRRVELAKALLHSPRILLLDEPTSGLDPQVKADFWTYLKLLRDQAGMTVLVTTHSMEEAELCDYLIILNEGEVVSEGTPVSLKDAVGSEVVVVHTSCPNELSERIQRKCKIGSVVLEDNLRIEETISHRQVADIMDHFADEISSITVSKPTLADVFLNATGQAFAD